MEIAPLEKRAPQRRVPLAPAAALLTGALLLLGGCATDSSSPETAAVVSDTAVPARPAPPDTAASDSGGVPPLTPDGWGDLEIGMSRQQVIAAAGEDANPEAVGGPEPEACDQFRPARAPQGMLVMVERDTLTRITISGDTGVESEVGIAVGDSAAVVKRTFGSRAEVTPHKYLPSPAEYITVWATDSAGSGRRGTVYETGADGLVMHIHAGASSIQYVEGCL